MRILLFFIIFVFSSLLFNILWKKTNVNQRFKKYLENLITIKKKFNNLQVNDLDNLSLTGITFLISLIISLLPIYFAYLGIQKLFSSQIISIISSGLATIPVFYRNKK